MTGPTGLLQLMSKCYSLEHLVEVRQTLRAALREAEAAPSRIGTEDATPTPTVACVRCGTVLLQGGLASCPQCVSPSILTIPTHYTQVTVQSGCADFVAARPTAIHPDPLILLPPPDLPTAASFQVTTTWTTLSCVFAWIGRFKEAIKKDGATWATPPMQQGGINLVYWDTSSGLDDESGGGAPSSFEYRRVGFGTWWRLHEVPCGEVLPGALWECEATTCNHCGRPMLLTTTLTAPTSPTRSLILLPHLLCPHLQGVEPALTTDIANRCWTLTPFGREFGVAAVTSFRWDACEPVSLQHKVHVALVNPCFRQLRSPWPTDVEELAPLSIYCNNLTGVTHQVPELRLRMLALRPSMVFLQEVWDHSVLPDWLPRSMKAVCGSVVGPGTGLVVAWSRALQGASAEHTVVLDDRHVLAVLVPTKSHGMLLLVCVHIHPKLSHAGQTSVLRAVANVEGMAKPELTILAGDLNMSPEADGPLRYAMSKQGVLRSFRPVFPVGTKTNFTYRQGQAAATAIDHIYIKGSVLDMEGLILPAYSTHSALYATATPSTAKPDPFAWKLFRWTICSPEQWAAASAHVSAAWGYLAASSASPDEFISVAHFYLTQLVPSRRSPMASLLEAEDLRPPYDLEQAKRVDSILRARVKDSELYSKSEQVNVLTITSSTRGMLGQPQKPLRPYEGILPHPSAILRTREERLSEVSKQASYVQENRHLRVDAPTLLAAEEWEPWQSNRVLHQDLPMPLILEALRMQLPLSDPLEMMKLFDVRQGADPIDRTILRRSCASRVFSSSSSTEWPQ
uniref:Endonuclease/exonuclease/phosphatase domain-containing protein n=1 Tax=Eutreptiella gymnastica TaxID=73025 RepID=A0A7S1N0U7_9EUGL|mmetsp:Transcript_102152/g.176380  ORF Transcript_102152/g.176380 Transcript_102152/m.176380 type:complete len:795 (+) Transcript_102152:128-2512(+)